MSLFSLHMRSVALTISIFFTYLVLFTAASKRSSDSAIYSFCDVNTTSASLSPTLNGLLANLSKVATAGEKFKKLSTINFEIGLFGSYFCRIDCDNKTCRDCVAIAAREITRYCPLHSQAIIWYDRCMLRYSNFSYFKILETIPSIYVPDHFASASRPKEFANELIEAMRVIATEAKKTAETFLTKEVRLPRFNDTIYSLMQCAPDLSGPECTECLKQVIPVLPTKCCEGLRGGYMLCPSCSVRYEVYPFYNLQDIMPNSLAVGPGPAGPLGAAIAGIVVGVFVAASVMLAFTAWLCRRQKKMKQYYDVQQEIGTGEYSLMYELVTIVTATNNFSRENKLGEGGFGPVYKGTLPSGQEIAVKRLSKSSGQGAQEFKTEVSLVAKLQHRNLVRLLGFCSGGGETLLVYEYVPNKSLDYFLFDAEKRQQLDWPTRWTVITGICRGVVYLHEDSRLRVIHRDLKASNILLDGDMNPKISDFGLARKVENHETQGNTLRIVGTYGYIAPEYAMLGDYSVKSDLFSFGVLLLEILHGKKNSSFHLTNSASTLIAYAWQLWNEGRALELMDDLLGDCCPQNEFSRYIHIALLCVQEVADNRPPMSVILVMLTSESTSLPRLERPPISVGRLAISDNHWEICNDACSANVLSISTFDPR